MAAGDTISGQIRVIRETTLGNKIVVAGNFGHTEVDHKADPQNALYINPNPKSRIPLGARSVKSSIGMFHAGEKIIVQHKSASLAEAIDYDADEFFVGMIEKDLNTGNLRERQLTVVDTGLTANPTSSTSLWVDIFNYTIPDRRLLALAGQFNVAAVEVA